MLSFANLISLIGKYILHRLNKMILNLSLNSFLLSIEYKFLVLICVRNVHADYAYHYDFNGYEYMYNYDYNLCTATGCVHPTIGSTGFEGSNTIIAPTITAINIDGCSQLMIACPTGSTFSFSNNAGFAQKIVYEHPLVLNCSSINSDNFFGFGDYGKSVQTVNCYFAT